MQRKHLQKIDRKSIKHKSEIVFFRAPNPIAFLTQFHDHFGTILAPFWEAPFAPILAALSPPGTLPRGLLGPLGNSWGTSGPPNLHSDRFLTNSERFWSHFGTIWDAPDPILDAQTFILEPLVLNVGGPGA